MDLYNRAPADKRFFSLVPPQMHAIFVHTLRGSRDGSVRKQTILLALGIAARATVTIEV